MLNQIIFGGKNTDSNIYLFYFPMYNFCWDVSQYVGKIFCIVTILCCCKIYIILSDVSDPWSQSGHLSMVHGERAILIIWYFRPFTLELCSTQNNSLYEKRWGRLTLLWGLYNLESSLNIVPFHCRWNGRLLHIDSTYECLKGIAVRIGDSKRVLPILPPSLYPLAWLEVFVSPKYHPVP